MGCVQLKKKDDSEIIKSNIPPEVINNGKENFQVEIIKQNNKEDNQNKNFIPRENIKNPNLFLKINNNVKNNEIKESKKKKIYPHKSYNNFEHINLSKFQSTEPMTKLQQENVTNIEKPSKIKPIFSQNDRLSIQQSLQNHFLFKNKDPQIISKIIDSLEIRTLLKGTTLFNKGDKGNYFYIVKEGKLELITDYGSKILNQDDNFGELALIENKKRTATVKCIENCVLYLLNGKIFREIVSKINEGDLKERLTFLKASAIFNVLDNVHLNALAIGMLKCEFDNKQTIVYEGDVGQSIYIIKSGCVKCFKGDQEIRVLGPKDFFGESAVLFNTHRSLSVYVVEKTICYQVSESFLIECLGKDFKQVILSSITKEALKNSKYMKIFANANYFNKIFECCKINCYGHNDIFLEHNKSVKKKFYVLITGNLMNARTGEIIAKRGELFGDVLIKSNHFSDIDIICQGECRTIEFDWDEIVPKLNLKIEKKKILSLFSKISHLKKISLFHETSENRLVNIGIMMKKEKFKKGEKIFEEGEMGDKLYLIIKGKVKAFKDKKFVRELCEGNCFGEVALLINEPRSATVIAETDTSLFSLSKDDFNSFIDKHMLNYLAKKISLQDNFNLTLNDLFFCKVLGKGKFGNVSLVHNSKNFFAIKAVNKKAADKQKILIKYFIQERNILLKLEHPFIMKLVKTFKTENYIFFLLEYISGRCLSKYLSPRQQKQLRNLEETKFYIATLLIVIDYLNSMRICHRDLKPDNIMVNERGYLKLIDFGTSIELKKDFTNTITGTPHYISPEVLLGKGYGLSCDYWSIGIIAHEIYYGYYPFGKNAKDPIDVYREVIKKELILRNGDPKVNQLINNLLKKKFTHRICSLEKAKLLSIFKDFNWDDLLELNLNAPYIPKIVQLKEFKEYNILYLNYAKKELENKDNVNGDSLLSSYNNDDEKDVDYDPNWADIF